MCYNNNSILDEGLVPVNAFNLPPPPEAYADVRS